MIVVFAVIGIVAFCFGFGLIMAWPVMLAWNYVVPVIFGAKGDHILAGVLSVVSVFRVFQVQP